jgi:predicted ester cyclase
MMPAPSNETVVRRFFEVVWNQGDVTQIDALMAPDFVSHNGLQVGISDSDGYARGVTTMRSAMPDFHTTLEILISDGDYVCVRGRDHGTHVGELFGHTGSGREVTASWIEIFRMQDGKLAEGWLEMDTADFFGQLAADK